MDRQIDVERIVLDGGHELEIEREVGVLSNGDSHRKPDHEVVGDVRRLAVRMRDERNHEPHVAAYAIGSGCGAGWTEREDDCYQYQTT